MTTSKSVYKFLPSSDLPLANLYESSGYPADEKASLENLTLRQSINNGAYFLGSYDSITSTLQGYVCSTRCASFDHDSLETHDPTGSILAIHSVCVASQYQRQGIATSLLKHYVQMICGSDDGITEIKLMCKEKLIGFYKECEFVLLGLSEIIHGQEPWFEMSVNVSDVLSRQKG